jgi:hypothetical protein
VLGRSSIEAGKHCGRTNRINVAVDASLSTSVTLGALGAAFRPRSQAVDICL